MWSLKPWRNTYTGQGGALLLASPMESELTPFDDQFDRIFQRLWSESGLSAGPWQMDFEETENQYVARLDAPGFGVEDFEVEATGNHLTIKAERNESQNGNRQSRYLYGRFERMIPLPEGAMAEGITARYHSGVLELHIPKGREAAKVRRIAVMN